jgi:trk system potassium uptake protein TrkH
MLLLPFSTADGESIGFVNALFVSTSAVCVTGLSPIDIGSKLSFFGQFVVLVLMQIGGLGLMTFTTVFYYWFGSKLPIADRLAIQETFQHLPAKQIRRLIFYIVSFTFAIEAIGAILLFIYWTVKSEFASVGQTLWNSVFHAVAAFTHSGFSLFPTSFVGYQKDLTVISIIIGLVFLGGLGFLVALELKDFLLRRIFSKDKKKFRLSVQTKLTLLTLGFLIFGGAALFLMTERSGVFAEMSLPQAIANSHFLSIVPRTAGFNSVTLIEMGGTSLLILMIFMFIGGGSGSTSGGIKVGTFGLLVAYTFSRLRGQTQLNLWNKTIPQSSIDKASAIVVASATAILTATLLLMFTETQNLSAKESQAKFVPILFETISAFGTVGLTLDFTSQLTEAGKVILSLVMFAGRVGIISLILALSLREKPAQFSYAEENVMIG